MLDATKIDRVVVENREHNELLFSPYNPLTGEGSPIPRTKLAVTDDKYILIPTYLAQTKSVQEMLEYQNVRQYAKDKGIADKDMSEVLSRLRIKYDFEYWAATCAHIFNKETSQTVLFLLRRPQRKLLKILIDNLFSNKPVRVILLKARQWGGSTLVQLFMAWIQIFHRENWNSVIVAHQVEASRNIRAMYTLMAQLHPKYVYNVQLKGFEGSTINKKIVGRGGVIYLGTMERPDGLRSGDYKLVHYSEVGLWRETKGKKPEDVIQAIQTSVPKEPFTVAVMESTAKGVGNFFHKTYTAAENGENIWIPVFVAWWEIEMYRMPFDSEKEMYEFIQSMTDKELYIFNLGATLEGLKWYRSMSKEINDEWRMCSEFPSTAQEAFQNTGHPAHSPLYIQQMRQFAKPPKFIGEVFADAMEDEASLQGVHVEPTPNGELFIWQMPDEKKKYHDRYVVSLDIGGKTSVADWSVIRVLDRLPLCNGGVPVFIATYRFHLDQDQTAWRAAQIATMYHNALLVVERNSLHVKGSNTEGDHSLTILDEIVKYYPNVYFRDDVDKVKEGKALRYGFFTGTANKSLIVDTINKGLRTMGFIERDMRMLDECQYYELKPDNVTYGAVEGQHDDIYMSSGIALFISKGLPLPTEIKQDTHQKNKLGGRIRTAADF